MVIVRMYKGLHSVRLKLQTNTEYPSQHRLHVVSLQLTQGGTLTKLRISRELKTARRNASNSRNAAESEAQKLNTKSSMQVLYKTPARKVHEDSVRTERLMCPRNVPD